MIKSTIRYIHGFSSDKSQAKEVILGCNKNYTTLAYNCTLENSKGILLLLFLNQQFITQHMEADRGSYFCNYIQKMHSNMKLQKKRKKVKVKELIDK